ncbi:MAG TPA: hypothetical protein VFQ26_04715 [Nitrospiraceae bacterium]|nr:hypothetical protein [Nitrospiraceae bacterium]
MLVTECVNRQRKGGIMGKGFILWLGVPVTLIVVLWAFGILG